MEANLCFRTRHLPAMQHHKKIVVHSSVRLPPLQARAGPPPGTARFVVLGAGVVLACALGAMHWKRARAMQLPMSRNSPTSHVGGDGNHIDDLVPMRELPSVLSEIFINPKPHRLTEIINQWLNEEDKKKVNKGQSLTSVLENKFPKTTITPDDYNFGLVFTLALISQKEYAKAEEICNKLIEVSPVADSRPELFLAIIKMMIAMDSMVQSPGTSIGVLKEKLNKVEEAWDDYCKKSGPNFADSPPF